MTAKGCHAERKRSISIAEVERPSPWCRMTRDKQYYVYIMTNKSRTLYTGVTRNLIRRVYEHKNKLVDGFTKKYNITRLVYYESTSEVRSAIAREKQIKGWLRKKKIALIESMNPEWRDLSEEWI
jgi:putative endonuclease